MESLSSIKRVRSDSDESELDSPESKRIQLDLLETLDDSDEFPDGHDLDSFIKSFEDEISPPENVELASDSGESRPDLEFLLEASDDELGLPPTESETVPVSTESVELGVFSLLDDQISNYDSFEYGFDYVDGDDRYVSANVNGNSNGEYVALDGLFDHTDLGFGPSDLSRRTESLPAQ